MMATMPGTVLIVDDTPANLAIVAEHLEEQGLRVLVAQGGEEALARAARMRPDLILLDVMMPGLDGFETCRRLKALETTQAIPVLFMSALSDAHSKLEGFEAGAIDYITKPVDIAEVLVRVRTHLTLRSMQLRLEAMSISDPLTGLANRRRFDTILRSEWQRALRGGGSVGAIMIDIDLFKRYNDYYGHVGGDRCLCAVARAVQSVVRQEIDLAARYGGEEFVLILPGADSAAVAEVAIRAHAAVLALNEPHAAAETGCVTVSVGAAALAPASEAGMGRLIELADEALYRAKQQGRNQVAVHGAVQPGALLTFARRSDRPSDVAAESRLQETLLDSRQRWRAFAAMAADIGFETDNHGLFSFITPDEALGWPAAVLLDQPAGMLLSAEDVADGFDPFRITTAVRRKRAWLRRADGSMALLAITAAPLLDTDGTQMGVRGVGVDWTAHDDFPSLVAADLRRGQLLEYLLLCIGQAADVGLVDAACHSLMRALGADGAALIDVAFDGDASTVLCQIGAPDDHAVAAAAALLGTGCGTTAQVGGEPAVLAIKCSIDRRGNLGVAFWRAAGRRGWDDDEIRLLVAAAGLVGLVAMHGRRTGPAGHERATSLPPDLMRA